jgi:isopenicillin-N N-acyltransferase-like protein
VNAFPYFHVSGPDPRDRGQQLGLAASGPIQATLEFYRRCFEDSAGISWPVVREIATRFKTPIAAYDEAILEEMEGIAEGAAVTLADVLAINARTEIMFGVTGHAAAAECTAFYVGPSASADGHVLLGQNWDYFPEAGRTAILVEVDQGDRPSFVMLAEAGLVGKLGFNAAGIGVATNFLLSDRDQAEAAVPYHVILRGILNARSVDEAVAAVVRARRAASANYVIASAAGIGVNVETGPGGVESVFLVHPVNDLISHANNFTCAVNIGDAGVEMIPGSPGRMARMRAGLEVSHGSLGRERLVELLRDHEGRPDSICQHAKADMPATAQATSVASWVVDLTERAAIVCCGQPCENDYEPFVPAFSRESALA